MTARRGSDLSVLEIMIVKVHILMSQHVLFALPCSLVFKLGILYNKKKRRQIRIKIQNHLLGLGGGA